jgi:phosphatidate cytidylyltransferase
MLKTRVISGIVLVLIALATLITGGYVLLGVTYFLAICSFYELARACGFHGNENGTKINMIEVFGYAVITFYYILLALSGSHLAIVMCIVLALIAFMFVYVFNFPKYTSEQIMSAFFCVMYGPVMLSFIYLTRQLPQGKYIVWFIFISSWVCDTAAYIFGRIFGKHKMAPVLSPHKSVEGAIGGIFGSGLFGGLYAWFVIRQAAAVTVPHLVIYCVLISAVGAAISEIGDLAASAIKRNHDIKDYGKLIPGHGGVMDRFDSVIFTAPITFAMAVLLLGELK